MRKTPLALLAALALAAPTAARANTAPGSGWSFTLSLWAGASRYDVLGLEHGVGNVGAADGKDLLDGSSFDVMGGAGVLRLGWFEVGLLYEGTLLDTRAAALKRGEVDVAYFLNGPIAEDVRRTPGLKLMAVRTNSVFFIDFVDQWDPKSPWADQRVRLAASLAIDRKAINEAEALGFSGLTGNIVPRHMEFALPIDPHPYDPKRAKQLLTEAGYANGFDAGDITPNPPYFSMAEAVGTYLGAVGIRTRLRTLERAAFLTAWGEKKLKGLVLGAQGAGGNAATRIEGVATKNGIYAYGVLPEVEDLFQRQARELDKKKREELLHQIQRLLHDRVVFAPIWENGFIRGVGPRAEEPALTLIPAFPYAAPLEDLRLKK
jgi:peptide/nickel transport system substrate-binding protein